MSARISPQHNMVENATAASINGDSWYGIEDPKIRKRIQDRLAQRARRKRLAEARSSQMLRRALTEPSQAHTPARHGDMADESEVVCLDVVQENNLAHRRTNPVLEDTKLPSTYQLSQLPKFSLVYGFPSASILPAGIQNHHPASDQRLPVPECTMYAAMVINSDILGYKCDLGLSVLIRESLRIPATLRPSPLQLTTPHLRWIDRLPFPRLRDNLILLASAINLHAFHEDIFYSESFTFKEGHPPWDPAGWLIRPSFRAKWGYLFH